LGDKKNIYRRLEKISKMDYVLLGSASIIVIGLILAYIILQTKSKLKNNILRSGGKLED